MEHQGKPRAGRLAGKVALVTGAGPGLGGVIATAMAHEGARLVICDINPEALKPVAAQLAEIGDEHQAVRCDVSDSAAVDAASWTAPVTLDAASWTEEAAAAAVPETRSPARDAAAPTPPEETVWPLSLGLPITLSLSRVAVSRTRSTRRSTILLGVTFSVRASTSLLRLAWVRSISRRTSSGSLAVVTGCLLPRP